MKKILVLSLILFILLTCNACCISKPDTLSNGTLPGIKNPFDSSANAVNNRIPDDTKIELASSFSDGVAFIRLVDAEENRTRVAIDTAGNILFDIGEQMLFEMWGNNGYQNGIWVYDNQIYDKTGTVIASPEMTGYDRLLTNSFHGFVLAMKKEESFSGDKYLIGVLNNKGEWHYPLSENHPIATKCGSYLESSSYYAEHIVDSIWAIGSPGSTEGYYNLTTNEFTSNYVHYDYASLWGKKGIYRYDTDGNATMILKDFVGDYLFENSFIGQYTNGESWSDYYDDFMLYDFHGNVLLDLSPYNIETDDGYEAYFKNEHLLIPVDNETGAHYLCLLNKNGEQVIAPIRIESNSWYYALEDYGFVFAIWENGTTTYSLCDYNGNITELGSFWTFNTFTDGLALVSTEDGYFYIDLNGNRVIG